MSRYDAVSVQLVRQLCIVNAWALRDTPMSSKMESKQSCFLATRLRR